MHRASTASGRYILCASLLFWPLAASAQAVRTGVVVTAEASATSDPYLDAADKRLVGAGELRINPWLSSESEVSKFDLSAFARGRAFSSRYDSENAIGASAHVEHRVSPRTTIFGQASVVSASARTPYSLSSYAGVPTVSDAVSAAGAVGPASEPVTSSPNNDISLFGLTGRYTTLDLAAGVEEKLASNSTIRTNFGYSTLAVSGKKSAPGYEGYRSISGGFTYSSKVGSHTEMGFTTQARKAIYQGQNPSVSAYDATANLEQALGQFWQLNMSAGVSLLRSAKNASYPSYSKTALIGNLSLCNRDQRRSLCLAYARSQQPSSLGRNRQSQTVSARYSERLSDRSWIEYDAGYSRSSPIRNFLIDTNSAPLEFLKVGAALTHSLDERLEGYAFVSAARKYDDVLTREASISIGIGLRLRLGAR